jgi:beta-N-acetylhexosaminidase
MTHKKRLVHSKVFSALLVLNGILIILILAQATGLFIKTQPELEVNDGAVDLDILSIEQKVAQMLVVQGDVTHMQAWKKMNVGGVHLYGRKTEHVFKNTVIDFQYDRNVPFFVTVDLEGCVNPFGFFRNFTAASEIDTVGNAFQKGFEEGKYLVSLGINLNFAPVVDLEDEIWKCRTFPGNETTISELAQSYLLGLQDSGVISTIKHYPGKTLVVRDPHKFVVKAEIDAEDVSPYTYLFEKGDAKAVMVSHIIVTGEVDSNGVPSVVSKKIIDDIKGDYDGLIISDEIHMLGLKSFYDTLDEMYIAVYAAGNDIILNFDSDPNEINRMIKVVSNAVRQGKISEKQIDNSVTKILEAKGFRVI